MGMQDKSKERKDQMRGKTRPQADSTAGRQDRPRDRAQDMTDPMRREEMAEGMRRERMGGSGSMPAEEMPEDGRS